jgi:iron-sulfur cluster repair protein YtfE (RIC family)
MQSVEPATQCLDQDHRRLDGILREVEQAAGAANPEGFARAGAQFATFATGLERHIEAEEGILFPELEELEPGAAGPTSVMHAEHEEIRALLGRIAGDLEGRAQAWQTGVARLKEVLSVHNMKEERILYPMANAAAQGSGRDVELAGRLRAALAGK